MRWIDTAGYVASRMTRSQHTWWGFRTQRHCIYEYADVIGGFRIHRVRDSNEFQSKRKARGTVGDQHRYCIHPWVSHITEADAKKSVNPPLLLLTRIVRILFIYSILGCLWKYTAFSSDGVAENPERWLCLNCLRHKNLPLGKFFSIRGFCHLVLSLRVPLLTMIC